ncbi:SUF system Fe-S cluster assembly protein [Xanthobacter agilis]|jgi:FeS assembly SUF system protein|uniref:FeS assembly SUF system protein n=1 Tax=Xanthobacter agilis TaxID=47492 RepID=A0ABU0LCL4_XANAG|nr:SUF system Fe-S cluster assembly protein [Xanthobacter agilis]MDQ0504897.1 FeS assembly SUF system protein [Xanthobacter agilis]
MTETQAHEATPQATPETAQDTGALPQSHSSIPQDELTRLTEAIVDGLKTVFDPEIPVDIYELGLIYKVDIADDRAVAILMTLTTPNCPAAAELPGMVESAILAVPGVSGAKVEITFDPPWDQGRMSDEARATLNLW